MNRSAISWRSKILTIMLALSVAMSFTPGLGLLTNAYADTTGGSNNDNDPKPVFEKTLKSNDDGTYDITLSVKGASSTMETNTKANVVVVMDTSWSMSEQTTTYQEAQYGQYGLVNNQYVQLYYREVSGYDWFGNPHYRYYPVRSNDSHSEVYYYDTSGWGWGSYESYTGTRYQRQQSTRDQVAIDATKSLVDSLLSQNTEQNQDNVEISFVSFNTNATKYQGGSWITDKNEADNAVDSFHAVNINGRGSGTNWEAALIAAKDLADAKKEAQPDEKVYVVFVSDGDPTYYVGGGNGQDYENNVNTCYEHAKDDAQEITKAGYDLYNIGVFGSVSRMDDKTGLTAYANEVTNDGHGISRYFAATDSAALNQAFADIVQTITSSLTLTKIQVTDGVTGMTTANIDGNAGNFRYDTPWNDAPKATFENGIVTWNLGDRTLSNGETASITFTVWPSQDALDLAADLNNGIKTYDELSDTEKASIKEIKDESGNVTGYGLKTNTDSPTLNYSVITTDDKGNTSTVDKDPINTENPDPTDLTASKLSVEKKWADELDPGQRAEVKEVKLDLYKDGILYKEGITLNEANQWREDNFVAAAGLMVKEGSAAYDADKYTVVNIDGNNYCILASGHDYEFKEEKINNHYELTNSTYHPMLIDGKLYNTTVTKDENGNITDVKKGDEIKTLSATNTMKGGVSITKKVVDENESEIDSKDAFTVTMHMLKADGTTPADYDYRIYYGEKNPEYEKNLNEDKTVSRTDHIKGTGDATVTLYQGDEIRFVNMESGTLYYVDEGTTIGYENTGISYQFRHGNETEYKSFTDDQKKTIDDKTYYKAAGNSSAKVVVTNTYHSGELDISKTVKVKAGDESKLDEAKKPAFTFIVNLYTDPENKDTTKLSGSYPYTVYENGQATETTGTITAGGTLTLKHGQTAKITGLPVDAHYDVIENMAQGYTTTKTGDSGTISENTSIAAFTNEYLAKDVVNRTTLKIKKVDEKNNSPLAGAVFILKKGEEQKGTYTTANGENGTTKGEATIEFSEEGTYTLTETTAPEGYVEAAGTWTLVVTKSDVDTVEYNEDENIFQWFYHLITGSEDPNFDSETGTLTVKDKPYEPAELTGESALKVTKEVTGKDAASDQMFTFKLEAKDDATKAAVESKDIVLAKDTAETKGGIKNGDTDTVSFGAVTFKKAGTYTFTVKETGTAPEGWTYATKDTDAKTVTVTVTPNKSAGRLEASVTNNNPTFENSYATEDAKLSGDTALKVTKKVTGKDAASDQKFTFKLESKDDTTKAAVESKDIILAKDTAETKGGIKNGETDTVSFGAVTFKKAGTYMFTVKETGTAPEGWTYATKDTDAKTVTVSVTMNKSAGRLEAAVSGDDLTFENTYATEDAKLTGDTALKVTKKVIGKDAASDQKFTFKLEAKGDATKVAVESKDIVLAKDTAETKGGIKNGETDTVSFGAVTFKKAGTYTFTVKETGTAPEGWTYANKDTDAKTITVAVTLNKSAGRLEASVTNNNPTFENSYATEDVKLTGDNALKVTKKVTGKNAASDQKFTFTLEAADAATKAAVGNDIVLGGTTAETKAGMTNGETQTVNFGDVTFKAEGTYKFNIQETSEAPSGWTYDKSAHEVTVTVTKDPSAGKLIAKVAGNNPTIENSYATEDVTLTGDTALKVTKKVTGKNAASDQKFTFTLEAADAATKAAVGNDIVLGGTTAETKAGMTNGETQTVSFGDVTFKAEGTYKFNIQETSDAPSGWVYDKTSREVTVVVTKDANAGKLAAEVTGNNPTITNVYSANGELNTKVSPILTKTTEGEIAEWSSETFEFTIEAQDGAPLPDKTTGTATFTKPDTQIIDFGTIQFSEPGTYKYTVREKAGTDSNWKYDTTPKEVEVTVADNGDGTLTASVTKPANITNENLTEKPNPPTPPTPVDPSPITVADPPVQKVVKGDKPEGGKYPTFNFKIAPVSTTASGLTASTMPMPAKTSLSITGPGAEEFGDITFRKTGKYVYKITEEKGSEQGWTYDTSEYTVTYEVTESADGSKLTCKRTITKSGSAADDVIFTNAYKEPIPEPTDISIEAQKKLTGKDLEEGEFKFQLKGKDENGKPFRVSARNDADGSITFPELHYTKPGTYTYTVTEVSGNAKGITYDTSAKKVTVTVTKNADGELVSEVDYGEAGKIVFTNKYKKPGTSDKDKDKDKKKSDTTKSSGEPGTGDSNNLTGWMLAGLGAAAALGITIAVRRRRNEA